MNYVDLDTWSSDAFGGEQPAPGSENQKRLDHICAIETWVTGHPVTTPSYQRDRSIRYAASLISRTDAELFGLSAPRFAFRLYLRDDDGRPHSFMNLRRSHVFRVQLEPPLNQQRHLIGDCVFARPPWLPAHTYHILTSDLGSIYGEEAAFRGTSYVQYSDTLGACSHAACFIASMALREYARGVYGLPEIAALVSGNQTGIDIGHLSAEQIAMFLNDDQVGLSAHAQRVSNIDNSSAETLRQDMLNGMRAYLLSGMPVVLHLDFYRMFGMCSDAEPLRGVKAIYSTNAVGITITPPPKPPAKPHAVVVIGCHIERDKPEVILHDPYWCPYLKCSLEQIAQSSCYLDNEQQVLRENIYLPVTPHGVCLALDVSMSSLDVRDSRLVAGARQLATRLPKEAAPLSPPSLRPLVAKNYTVHGDNFRLTRTKDVAKSVIRHFGALISADQRQIVEQRANEFVEQVPIEKRNRWLWIQYVPQDRLPNDPQYRSAGFLLWNGHLPGPFFSDLLRGEAEPSRYLAGHITPHDGYLQPSAWQPEP